MFKLRMTVPREYDDLMDFAAYASAATRLQQYDEWAKDQRMT